MRLNSDVSLGGAGTPHATTINRTTVVK